MKMLTDTEIMTVAETVGLQAKICKVYPGPEMDAIGILEGWNYMIGLFLSGRDNYDLYHDGTMEDLYNGAVDQGFAGVNAADRVFVEYLWFAFRTRVA